MGINRLPLTVAASTQSNGFHRVIKQKCISAVLGGGFFQYQIVYPAAGVPETRPYLEHCQGYITTCVAVLH